MDKDRQADFHTLLTATCDNTVMFQVHGGDVSYGCPDCPARFPQTDDGWRSLKEHGLEHGRPTTYRPDELRGKHLLIFIVETDDSTPGLLNDPESSRYDIYGQDERGYVYHLATQNRWNRGGFWKWKRLPSRLTSLPEPMQNEAESQSSSSKGGAER